MSTRIHNILVIVDPTAKEHPAVEKGAWIAEKFGARLELYACETKESRAARYAAHIEQGGGADFVAHIRAVIDAVAQPLRQRGLDVTTEVDVGDPLYAKLLERTKTTCADLVVKDTHHHSILKRTLITNTDWHLIRGCPVPLLLTKPKVWASAPALVAAVDPGHVNDKPVVLDNRILEWANSFRDRLQGSLRVVHAYLPAVLVAEAVSGMPAMMSVLTPQMMEEEKQRALERVVELVSPYGIAPEEVTVELGVASEVLPRFTAEVGADILAMGAISRSGLQRVFIGSTAERVLEHVPCDILVIKPPDFAATLPF
jgi:universal stress protein E